MTKGRWGFHIQMRLPPEMERTLEWVHTKLVGKMLALRDIKTQMERMRCL